MPKPDAIEERSSSTNKIVEAINTLHKEENKTSLYTEIFKFIAFSIPVIITFSIWMSSVEKRLALVEEKQNIILEIKEDIKELKHDVGDIKLKIARIESNKQY